MGQDFLDDINFKIKAVEKDYEQAQSLYERLKNTDDTKLKRYAINAVELGAEALQHLKKARAEGSRTRKAEQFEAAGLTCHQGCGENIEKLKAALEDGK